MRILALDQAEYVVGFAIGDAGALPRVETYRLRAKDERTEDAIARYAVWLRDMIAEHEVKLCCVEHFVPLGAMKGRTNAASHEGQIGLGYAARAVAAVAGVHFRSPHLNTIRSHFCGAISGGSRALTKEMVIKRARMLGYIPRDCKDDNMADAAALFDFSSNYFARKAPAFILTAGKAK